MKKHKILTFSDHPASCSGVATQGRYLYNGLAATGKYTFRCFGAAIKHENYDTMQLCPDVLVLPTDGFGTKEQIRMALASEQPDAVILFNDPRFFQTHFEIENEIHQFCPILYWHLWDQNEFAPTYNKPLYDSVDTLNCINYPTYEFLLTQYPPEQYPGRVNFVPHAIPEELFKPLEASFRAQLKRELLPGKDGHLIVTWVARNARRKQPNDVLWSWKIFLDQLEAKHGHRKATLVLHTDPFDAEGPNLLAVTDMLGIRPNVMFSTEKADFHDMVKLYNVSDVVISRSCAEGFGLPTLEAMFCGKPIIALQTGGLTRQVVDHRDGSHNGFALPVELKSMAGSQNIPWIVEDYVTNETVAATLMKFYELPEVEREALGAKALAYARSEFNINTMISNWDESLQRTIADWRTSRRSWELMKVA